MEYGDFGRRVVDEYKRCGRVPPLIICPYCQPGTISYAGKVLAVVCADCRAAIAEARR